MISNYDNLHGDEHEFLSQDDYDCDEAYDNWRDEQD